MNERRIQGSLKEYESKQYVYFIKGIVSGFKINNPSFLIQKSSGINP